MKNLIVLIALLIGVSSFSQRTAFIDTDYILGQIKEYTDAQLEIDALSEKWRKEIEEKYKIVEKKRAELQQDLLLLTPADKEKREGEIKQIVNKAMELQTKYFGVNGELFAKRKELLEPITNKLFDAVQKIASTKKYGFVFDKSNQTNLIFADDKFDLSNQVILELKRMGVKLTKPGEGNGGGGEGNKR
jgi:outer membrane protein